VKRRYSFRSERPCGNPKKTSRCHLFIYKRR
jgi:hypothetical protein